MRRDVRDVTLFRSASTCWRRPREDTATRRSSHRKPPAGPLGADLQPPEPSEDKFLLFTAPNRWRCVGVARASDYKPRPLFRTVVPLRPCSPDFIYSSPSSPPSLACMCMGTHVCTRRENTSLPAEMLSHSPLYSHRKAFDRVAAHRPVSFWAGVLGHVGIPAPMFIVFLSCEVWGHHVLPEKLSASTWVTACHPPVTAKRWCCYVVKWRLAKPPLSKRWRVHCRTKSCHLPSFLSKWSCTTVAKTSKLHPHLLRKLMRSCYLVHANGMAQENF